MVRGFALQEITEVSKTGRQSNYFYFTFIEKSELYIWEEEALIPRSQIINFYIPSQEVSHRGYKAIDEAVSNIIPITFVGVNTFCKAQWTFKAQHKTLIALVISANSGSFCDVCEGLS